MINFIIDQYTIEAINAYTICMQQPIKNLDSMNMTILVQQCLSTQIVNQCLNISTCVFNSEMKSVASFLAQQYITHKVEEVMRDPANRIEEVMRVTANDGAMKTEQVPDLS